MSAGSRRIGRNILPVDVPGLVILSYGLFLDLRLGFQVQWANWRLQATG